MSNFMDFVVITPDNRELDISIPYCEEYKVISKIEELLNLDYHPLSYYLSLVDDKYIMKESQALQTYIKHSKNNSTEALKYSSFNSFADMLKDQGERTLRIAAFHGNTELVKLLIECNISQTEGEMGITPLMDACKHGFYEIAEVLVDADASFAPNLFNKTPLLIAVEHGNSDIVELLLDRNHPQTPDNSNNYPLHVAILNNREFVVDTLLRYDVVDEPNSRNKSALYLAAERGNVEIVRMLLNANLRHTFNETLLFSPIRADFIDILKLLLDSGIDPNHTSNTITPIEMATSYGRLNMVKLLIEYGAKYKHLFMPAIKSKNVDLMKYIYSLDENDAHMFSNITPMRAAADNSDHNMIRALHKLGFTQQSDAFGDTPLHIAANLNNYSTVEELVNIGAKQTANVKGITPLILATENNSDIIVNLLCMNNPLHGKAGNCKTPLVIAAEKGNINMVDVLIKHGALNNGKKAWFLPLMAAKDNHRYEIVEKLLEFAD